MKRPNWIIDLPSFKWLESKKIHNGLMLFLIVVEIGILAYSVKVMGRANTIMERGNTIMENSNRIAANSNLIMGNANNILERQVDATEKIGFEQREFTEKITLCSQLETDLVKVAKYNKEENKLDEILTYGRKFKKFIAFKQKSDYQDSIVRTDFDTEILEVYDIDNFTLYGIDFYNGTLDEPYDASFRVRDISSSQMIKIFSWLKRGCYR